MSGESEDIVKDDVSAEGSTLGDRPSETDDKDVAAEKKGVSSQFAEFMRGIEKESTAEGKIRLSLDFMRDALTSTGTPRFKDFWEGRRICLPLFKENISPKARSQLWSAYIELSSEAKSLKEILDEQSAFAVEQIELAIQGLERDLEHYDLLLNQSQEEVLLIESETLREKRTAYNAMHRELLLLNTFASRVNGLRKEVVKTEMRIRIKNKLLERLSLCGDHVFPKRKELIKQVSQEFVKDVEAFITSHFREEEIADVPLYALREEIKQLQSIAKVLTLNTHAFTDTRLKLSACWDKIRERDKERKRESQQKRQAFKQNYDLVMEKIKPFAEQCLAGISVDECNLRAAEIFDFMRTVELGREEVRQLKEEVFRAKRGPLEKEREAQEERQRKEREQENKRREAIQQLKDALNSLQKRALDLNLEELTAQRDALHQQFEGVTLSKTEKQIVERLFKQLKDAIDDKREKALLMLSEDDLKALEQLKSVLEERKARRAEIKNQLEYYRKLLGGSGFDFEKAMMYREQIEAEKATLEKIQASIEEIEEKIDAIEG